MEVVVEVVFSARVLLKYDQLMLPGLLAKTRRNANAQFSVPAQKKRIVSIKTYCEF